MSETILEVRRLTKNFGENTILRGIDVSIRQGEVVVLVGPSGCGKSTFLRCLNGIEPISGGEILLDGMPVLQKDRDLVQLRQKIGMVFQSYDLFPHLSVIRNITLAPIKVQGRNKKDAEEEARALLARVGLSDKESSYPRELSGGQKQRVAIVRALIMHPEIMLFDEVTAALDPEMVREVLNVIMDLAAQGRTMLIVTHEMAFARAIADRVLFMDEGRIVEENSPDVFFTSPETERAQKFLQTFVFDSVHKSIDPGAE